MTTATSSARDGASLQVLNTHEYRILKAICSRIVPEANEARLDLALKIDSVLAGVRKELSRDFKLLLLILEYGTLFLGFTLKQFTRMSPEEQDRYLAGLERSGVPFKRVAFQAIKRAALAAFYGSQESWPGIKYRGPWLDKGYPHDYEGKGIQVPR